MDVDRAHTDRHLSILPESSQGNIPAGSDFTDSPPEPDKDIMTILVINSGSSSVKFGLFDGAGEHELERGHFDGLDDTGGSGGERAAVIERLLQRLSRSHRLTALGHRVVHGGAHFHNAVQLDGEVMERLRSLRSLAPLHNPAAIQGMEIARTRLPELPQVAVFDTAFGAQLPEVAWRYALPKSLADAHAIRRYGFHGISHQYVAAEAARLLQQPVERLRLITLHLGNGASAAAIDGGRCVETSMGMTPQEGLVMGSRAGDIDSAIVTLLQREVGLSVEAVDRLLNRESGLKGLCGDGDMQRIRQRAQQGDREARLAIDIFVHRLKKYVGAYMAILGGLDALIFTGGIGEHDAASRFEVCQGLQALGIRLDTTGNDQHKSCISQDASQVRVLVIPTNEELAIARQTVDCLAQSRVDVGSE